MEIYRIKNTAVAGQIAVMLLCLVICRRYRYVLPQRGVAADPPRVLRVKIPRSVVVQPCLFVLLLAGECIRQILCAVVPVAFLLNPRLSVRRVLYPLVLASLIVCNQFRTAQVIAVVVVLAVIFTYVRSIARFSELCHYPCIAQKYMLAVDSRTAVAAVKPPCIHLAKVHRLAVVRHLVCALSVVPVYIHGSIALVARLYKLVPAVPLIRAAVYIVFVGFCAVAVFCQ